MGIGEKEENVDAAPAPVRLATHLSAQRKFQHGTAQ
jgi:hypothetical protein